MSCVREAVEKEAATRRYEKLQAAGLTDQAQKGARNAIGLIIIIVS